MRGATSRGGLVWGRPWPVAARSGLAAVVAVAVLGGCSSVQRLTVPTPPPGTAGATTTAPVGTLPDLPEASVAGSTPSTTVAVGPGKSTIDGTVLGPEGPVEGATVQAERFVGDASAATEATTAADGSFTITGVLGGRYRLRAWKAPSLAQSLPQVLFLADGATNTVSLQLASYTGLNVTWDLNPKAPFTGEAVNLAVEVTEPTVGADGVVRQVPQPSVSVLLESSYFTAIDGSGGSAVTNGNGEAVIELSCLQDGPSPLGLLVGGSTAVSVPSPTCLDPETTSTTSTTSTTTTTLPVAGSPPSSATAGSPTAGSPTASTASTASTGTPGAPSR